MFIINNKILSRKKKRMGKHYILQSMIIKKSNFRMKFLMFIINNKLLSRKRREWGNTTTSNDNQNKEISE